LKNYEAAIWCPKQAQEVEGRSFSFYDGHSTTMHSAISNEKFRGSLKEAFLEGKSMTAGKLDDKL
jgi:hypothetical protein